jgi:acetylornithine deacetylase/succinyl-diaminopimelate desuccinylase-like protein
MLKSAAAAAAFAMLAGPALAAPTKDTGEAAFRALYKELVETNTTGSAGNCTLAAERMAARLKAAGFPDSDLHLFTPEGKPKDGGLVAIYPGKEPKAKAILLLAHIDVVEAKREDWTRDPFVMVEEDGCFYGRGVADDKAQAAIWTDMLIRYRQEGYKPRRTLKVALTCGEEGGGQVNGAAWLMKNRRELVDAGLALNEGGGGAFGPGGKRLTNTVLVAEKAPVTFTIETTNPGGHSSRPRPDNAIYQLSNALQKVAAYEFPVQFNDGNRGFFQRMSKVVGGETGAAMAAIVANPNDEAANTLLSKDVNYHAYLRTTCVATMLDAGHAQNALPQRARATVSCRILPGVPDAEVKAQLDKVVGDPGVKITAGPRFFPEAKPPALTPKVLGPIETVTQQMWPGVAVVPVMEAGATDSSFVNAAGIPSYGVSGLFFDPDLGGVHGLNERVRVQSVMESREFLYRLVKLYGDQKD